MQKTVTPLKTILTGKTPKEILRIWEQARGIWKKKKVEPIQYLEKMRQEWERRTP